MPQFDVFFFQEKHISYANLMEESRVKRVSTEGILPVPYFCFPPPISCDQVLLCAENLPAPAYGAYSSRSNPRLFGIECDY